MICQICKKAQLKCKWCGLLMHYNGDYHEGCKSAKLRLAASPKGIL